MPDDAASPARPTRTKSQRQLTPARMFLYRLAVYLGAFVLEVLWRTSRMRIIGGERLETLLKEQGAVVLKAGSGRAEQTASGSWEKRA